MLLMKDLMNRAKYVLDGEEGASNVEIIVWISVVLVLATVLFLFRDAIQNFINNAIGRVNTFQVQ